MEGAEESAQAGRGSVLSGGPDGGSAWLADLPWKKLTSSPTAHWPTLKEAR